MIKISSIYGKNFLFLIGICLTCTNCLTNSSKKIITSNTTYPNAMVVCSYPDAAYVGRNILKQGGNAFDAAIAVQFALQVTYPRAGNIAGGGFMVYFDEKGNSGSLDFRETAPHGASKLMYVNNNGPQASNASTEGGLAVGVPGSVAGMYAVHQRFGSLPWYLLIQPAIDLAKNGYLLSRAEAEHFNEYAAQIRNVSNFDTPFNQKVWKANDRFIQPHLAETLTLIRDLGADGFYTGQNANFLVSTITSHGGIIDHKDLSDYRTIWRTPISTNYRGYHIYSPSLPSSGGILIAQMLKANETYNFTSAGFNSTSYMHGIIELQRRAFADRTHLGDPDFVRIDVDTILSLQYIKDRNNNISMSHSTPSQSIKSGHVTRIESFETTHFSVIDKLGNAVAITTTLNGNYGSKLMVKDGGYLLNNEMDDFSIKPGQPNQFGLVGNDENSIQPGKRMLSSMTPTIIAKNNKVVAIVGSPGGPTIINTVLETIFNLIDFGMNIDEAVKAGKFHSQWQPDEVYIEKGMFDFKTIDSLKQMGHNLKEINFLGKLDCIQVLPDGSKLGGTDPRKGDGTIAGY